MVSCPRCGTENPSGFRFCGNCAGSLGIPPSTQVHRRKVVTVLFCDVVGSTRLGEQRDPETMRAIMARYFEALRRVLERHGGTVEKFIGDAVMAVFGHPVLHEDDALRAVRAAAELRSAIDRLNGELGQDWGAAIEVRIGINTGEVVAGNGAATETLVTGDAVNVAARLQTAAEPAETLIGEETYRLVRDAVTAHEVEPLSLKGKSSPVRAWRLTSVSPEAAGRARHLDSPLVGRVRERRLLDEAFERAVADRTCVLFTLLGPAGVGKSRLVHEFLSGVRAGARVLRGRCLPYGEGITFWPLAEVVKQAAGIEEGDSAEAARERIERLAGADEHGPVIARHVAACVGLTREGAAAEEIFWGVRCFLELLAREGPLVLVFDDIHWAEPTFLDLLEHISDWSREAPILLLCVARPELLELRPTWAGGKLHASTVLLEPLAEDDVAELIANLLGAVTLARSVLTRIAAAAEGNPLFVEEFVAMLVDEGVLLERDGQWLVVGDLDRVAVPQTIRSLLAARIDRLAAAERRVIERASVVGKVFWRGAVAELAPESMRPEVGPSLLGLVRKELVRPDRSDFAGDDAFRFRHLLIRDAAYDALPKGERFALHERFAGWLERVAGERVAEYEEVIGYHLEQAFRYRSELGPVDEEAGDLARRAGLRLAAAGQRAADRGDVPGARKLMERASALLPVDDPGRAEALLELATATAESGDLARADELFGQAVEQADGLGLAATRWRAIVRRVNYGYFLNPEGAVERGRPLVEAAIGAFEQLGDHRGAAEAWTTLGEIHYYLGHLQAEGVAARKALAHATQIGDDRLELQARMSFTASALWSDEPLSRIVDEAEAILQRAQSLGRRLPEAQATGVIGRALALQGHSAEGRRLVAQSRDILRELGRAAHVAGSSQWAGMVEWASGDYAAQERVLRDGAEALEAMGEQAMLSTSYADMAIALHRLGRFDEAEGLCVRAEALTASDDVSAIIGTKVARALILSRRGELEHAAASADEALALADASEYSIIGGWAREQLADVLLQARGADAAVAELRAAREYFLHKEAAGIAQRIERQLARLGSQGEGELDGPAPAGADA
ncbi:MAG TPA: adenylate/guanylate cyclase domain-containing protein [Candidatus Limnocylindria bacterium]|nr:adenylate/guanylate cyclase domain-containing protein [Candidatus Limnocylindria bacterium]